MADESIKKKILALMAKTTSSGCTEEEAMLASKKVQELLHKYQLTLSAIKIKESKCVQESYETGIKGDRASRFCLSAINYFCDTKGWMHKGIDGKVEYVFFGLEHDVLIAEYICKVCDWAILWGAEDFKLTDIYEYSSNKPRIKKDFEISMATRLAERIRKMKDDQIKEDVKTTGRDLVVLKSEIVAQGFRELDINLRSPRSRSRYIDPEAASAGRSAGDKVQLNPGVTRGEGHGQLN